MKITFPLLVVHTVIQTVLLFSLTDFLFKILSFVHRFIHYNIPLDMLYNY